MKLFGSSRPFLAGQEPGIRLCLACAPGGHLAELLSLSQTYERFPRFFVINRGFAGDDLNPCGIYSVSDYGRGTILYRLIAVLRLLVESIVIYLRERPNAILTTGPSTGFFLALLIRANGGKVIFVECSAQVSRLSKSGLLFRFIAHRFFVQWPGLSKRYSGTEYFGLLL